MPWPGLLTLICTKEYMHSTITWRLGPAKFIKVLGGSQKTTQLAEDMAMTLLESRVLG